MTLAQLLELAQRVRRNSTTDSDAERLADGITDLLAEAAPCGYEEPEVRPGIVGVPNSWTQDWVTPNESRGFARMLLRSSDQAES